MRTIQTLIDRMIDESWQELLVNGTTSMTLIAQDQKATCTASPFSDAYDMSRLIQDFARSHKVRVDPMRPAGGGIIDIDGDCSVRWHVMMPPVASTGPQLSLRQLSWSHISLSSFHHLPENQKMLEELRHRGCVFFSGPTGSGKTTLMTKLIDNSFSEERLFILETLPEIPLLSDRWVRLVEQLPNMEGQGAFSLTDLLRESLRMRPDRFVLGEIRGQEALALFQMLMASHEGVWATIHASGPDMLVPRLSQLSGVHEAEWQQLFEGLKPCYVQMQRKKPRVAGLFQFENGTFHPIFFDQKPA
ncbi:ATPase, T2SS/T4P/T4SS family [Pseudobacteriovorax antillogorgiicola]|uniref:Type II/IV secretion system protein n=1 Tax=Pseudobacteriovorax antillogorgiicola TaxID=1513793 RepID=A0A1Y6CCR9_9BACT|nr:ATPase, T2SS/T4P/T4SS family [Pseudobacteriovorax antillogorgiicola]TCS49471.1 type II/IV secretion system protein [Pseudobacteriovorax antillogorgiicola]SMF46233.1 Type II/IV secretion system protein [Pseudobacteriovorax antillogorgiicola]